MTDEMTVEEWLAIRKEAGLKIDPETAEVNWCYAQVADPYGVYPDLPEECDCVGRAYFARAQGSDVWVEFGDLPKATEEALWNKHKRRLGFPAGLEPFFDPDNRPILRATAPGRMTVKQREQWLAIRKEAGLKIDPETAAVDWDLTQVGDPYGVYPDLQREKGYRFETSYFARAPGSDVWVEFRDLPEATRDALLKKHGDLERAALERSVEPKMRLLRQIQKS